MCHKSGEHNTRNSTPTFSDLPGVGTCIVHPLVLAITSGSSKVSPVLHCKRFGGYIAPSIFLSKLLPHVCFMFQPPLSQGRERAACVLAHAAVDAAVKRLLADAPVCAALVGPLTLCGFLFCCGVILSDVSPLSFR
jgi:hypothetical protein